MQGEAGFIPVPPRFLERIRELCDQHRIVMIADEVQCGFGRTGRLFAIEHYGLVPDVIASAKSLGAGMPIGAVTGRAEVMDSAHLGGIGGTYGGSPVACAAALAAVNIIRQPECLAHARRLGDVMRDVLNGWKAKFSIVGDVRGLGPNEALMREKRPPTRADLDRADPNRPVVLTRTCGHICAVPQLPPGFIPAANLSHSRDARRRHHGRAVVGRARGRRRQSDGRHDGRDDAPRR